MKFLSFDTMTFSSLNLQHQRIVLEFLHKLKENSYNESVGKWMNRYIFPHRYSLFSLSCFLSSSKIKKATKHPIHFSTILY